MDETSVKDVCYNMMDKQTCSKLDEYHIAQDETSSESGDTTSSGTSAAVNGLG